MNDNDLDMNNDITLSFNESNIDSFFDDILPSSILTDNDDVIDVHLEQLIDNTIEKLEKILKLEALSDDELAELHSVSTELHDDIDMLDFDGEY